MFILLVNIMFFYNLIIEENKKLFKGINISFIFLSLKPTKL